jgi:hypothetical protein
MCHCPSTSCPVYFYETAHYCLFDYTRCTILWTPLAISMAADGENLWMNAVSRSRRGNHQSFYQIALNLATSKVASLHFACMIVAGIMILNTSKCRRRPHESPSSSRNARIVFRWSKMKRCGLHDRNLALQGPPRRHQTTDHGRIIRSPSHASNHTPSHSCNNCTTAR